MKETTRAGIMRYVEHGVPPGDFLTAVLSNDLMGAMGRADEENQRDLLEICQFVHMEIPGVCHGSLEKMKEWVEAKERARAEG
jgi:hypothetical protein